jgi:hypothetical protein
MALYSYIYERPARKHFRWWHGWAVRSRLQPMIEVARMLKRRFENVITYLRHRITNAGSLREAPHLAREKDAGLVVAPISVIEVARDDDEGGFLIDRVADGHSGRRPNAQRGLAVLAGEAFEWVVEMDFCGVNAYSDDVDQAFRFDVDHDSDVMTIELGAKRR